jgi:hypothetical protein
MTEQSEQTELSEALVEPPPFLRITSTYPTASGRVGTIQLDMNPGDTDSLGTDEGPDGEPATSWFTDFCTCIIDAMRRSPSRLPTSIVINGAALPIHLAERMRHAEDCDGTCGVSLPLIPVGEPGGPAVSEPGAAPAGGEV